MRLDVFLHSVCLLKSRTLAKEACVRKRVAVNGSPAKSSRAVSAGDRLRLDLGYRILDLEVTGIPSGQVSKNDAPSYYRILSDRRIAPDDMETDV